MDHVTRLAQALSYDDTRSLTHSELREMTTDELMSYIGRKDKTASAADATKVGVGKVLRAAKSASKSGTKRAATGAAAGAAGGAATELSKKEPTKGGVAKGVVAGAAAGAVGGAVARPGAKAILKMKGPVGKYARESVTKSRIYDFVKAVKKPFTKTAVSTGWISNMVQGAGKKLGQTVKGKGRMSAFANRNATRGAEQIASSHNPATSFANEYKHHGMKRMAAGSAAYHNPNPTLSRTKLSSLKKSAGVLGTLGTAAKGFAMRHPVQTASAAVGGLGGAVGGGAMAGQGKRVGGAVGGGIAGAAAGFAAPNIVKRISQMAGPKINRQGGGMMGKLLPAGGAAKQTINATRI
jgi:hypothetical protein